MKQRFTPEEWEAADTKDILAVAKSLGLELEKRGNTYKVPKGGGFYITPAENAFNCFAEKEKKVHGGGPVQLVMFINGCDAYAAAAYLLDVPAGQA